MNLSKDDVRKRVETQGLVEQFADLDKQLTANGFDVRVAAFVEVRDGGALAVDKKNNRPPKLGRAFVLPGFESRLEGYGVEEIITTDSFAKLIRAQPYLVVTCERVNTPNDLMIHAAKRSSVFRFTQSLMGFGFTEAGYNGFLTFLLLPTLDCEIQLGTRIAQLSWSTLTSEASYEDQSEFNHQGGKIF